MNLSVGEWWGPIVAESVNLLGGLGGVGQRVLRSAFERKVEGGQRDRILVQWVSSGATSPGPPSPFDSFGLELQCWEGMALRADAVHRHSRSLGQL